MSDESTVGTSSGGGLGRKGPASVFGARDCTQTIHVSLPPPPPEPQAKPFTRLQRVIVSGKSKAMQLQRQPRPVPIVKPCRSRSLGKLALMLQVPDDVVREIAEYLSPLDLLHLARSTRALRGMLMSKSARSIWRAALDAQGIPRCPSDINEPQLISLMFDKSCQGCGAPRVRKVDYKLRVRLCPGCFSLNVIRGSKLATEIHNMTSDDTIYRLCAYTDALSEYHRHSRYLDSSRRHFFRPDFVDVAEKYMSYEPGSAAQKQFVEARERIVEEIADHASDIDDWFAVKKDEDRLLKINSRSESILKRLRELGYTDGDFVSSGNEWHGGWRRLVYRSCKLTNKDWEDILPQLEKIIRERRETRALIALRKRQAEVDVYYRDYCKTWAEIGDEFPPISLAELRDLFEVRMLLEKKTEISEDEWSEIRALLPGVFRGHTRRIRRDCADLIVAAQEKAGLAPIPVDDTCDPIDTILSHPSAFISWNKDGSDKLDTCDELLAIRRDGAPFMYSSDHVWPFMHPPSPIVPKCVEALMRSLRWSETVTMQYAENLGAIFVCNCCPPSDQRMMKWKELVNHFCSEQWYGISRAWFNDHPIGYNNDIARDDLVLLVPGPLEERPLRKDEK